MGWAYGTNAEGREVGYSVQATCDEDGCETQIDRGLGYVCGGMHDGSEDGCVRRGTGGGDMTDPLEVLVDDDASDRLAVAYWTGRIDHRNQQPRRVDHADRGPIATAYHHGYDHNDNDGGEAA